MKSDCKHHSKLRAKKHNITQRAPADDKIKHENTCQHPDREERGGQMSGGKWGPFAPPDTGNQLKRGRTTEKGKISRRKKVSGGKYVCVWGCIEENGQA